MASKKGLVLLANIPSYSVVQSSRALHLFLTLKEKFTDTHLIMKYSEKNEVQYENLIQVKPIIKIDGKFILIKGMLYRLQFSFFAFRHILSHHCDFAILRGYDSILLMLLSKISGVKVFYDFHGKYDLELSQQGRHVRALFVKYIDKLAFELCDGIIVVSKGIEAQVSEYKEKCIIIPNGVDIHKIDDINASDYKLDLRGYTKVVGFVGNWEYHMNVEDMCLAAEYAPDVLFIIVGEGFNAGNLVNKYKDISNIVFTGRLPQIDAFAVMHKFDICILPYDKSRTAHSDHHDFFSARKTKEYIAAGKPIIVSDVIGKEAFLIPDFNCALYESRNPKDLADRIRELFNNPQLLSSMGSNNMNMRNKFSWDGLIGDSGIIEKILDA